MDPQNKTAMITGGAGGIGGEFVKILLENGAKNVAIVDLPTSQSQARVAEFEGKYGKNRAVFFPCDITETKEFEATFKRIVDTFDRFDILINSAGTVQEKKIEQAINVNLMSVMRSSLWALDHMGKHKGGKGGVIVNVSSIYGLDTQNCGFPIYSATKHGVIGFSQCLANFHYLSEVRVLTLCPGLTITPLINATPGQTLDIVDSNVFDVKKYMPKQTADNVSRALLHLIQKAENGTIWVSENDQLPYAVKFPYYSKLTAAV